MASLAYQVMGGGFSAGQVNALGGTVKTAISAAGTTRVTATVLTTAFNLVSTSASLAGVSLPTITTPGDEVWIYNDNTGNTLVVYPDSATIQINSQTVGTGVQLGNNTAMELIKVSATRWIAVLSA